MSCCRWVPLAATPPYRSARRSASAGASRSSLRTHVPTLLPAVPINHARSMACFCQLCVRHQAQHRCCRVFPPALLHGIDKKIQVCRSAIVCKVRHHVRSVFARLIHVRQGWHVPHDFDTPIGTRMSQRHHRLGTFDREVPRIDDRE